MEIPVQFLEVPYENIVLPHDGSKGNIQVRIFVPIKVAPMPETTCGLNGSLLDHINKEFMQVFIICNLRKCK